MIFKLVQWWFDDGFGLKSVFMVFFMFFTRFCKVLVGTVTSDFVARLRDIEVNDTPRPAIKYRPNKQLWLICRGGLTYYLS